MVDKWFSKGTWLIVSIAVTLLAVALLLVPALGFAQGEKEPNWSATAPEEGTPLGRTDDPLGRVEIPVTVQNPPDSNVDITSNAVEGVDLVFGDEAATREEETRSYSSPLVIPGADFSSDGKKPDSYFFSFYGGRIEGGDGAYLMAPVYLPHGVTVSSMYVSYIDNNPAYGLSVKLFRVDNYDGTVNIMASFSTTDEPEDPSICIGADPSIDFPKVAYPRYSYYVGTGLPTDTRLYSVRLYYGQ